MSVRIPAGLVPMVSGANQPDGKSRVTQADELAIIAAIPNAPGRD